MDTLPPELLHHVAAQLDRVSDLRSFRLTNKRCSIAAIPALFRSLHLLNTFHHIRGFEVLQRRLHSALGVTKELTIFHASWPAISVEGWRNHWLVGSEFKNDKRALTNFLKFLSYEHRRDPKSDTEVFSNMIRTFPTLRKLTIAHIHHWKVGRVDSHHYRQLHDHIGVVPLFEGSVEQAVSQILPALNSASPVSSLYIQGILDPQGAEKIVCPNIIQLEINSMVVCHRRQRSVDKFLSSFPNVEQVNLTIYPAGFRWDQMLLGEVMWKNLKEASIKNLWTSEDELIEFIERHPRLRRLHLGQITFRGSMRSFLGRVFDIRRELEFTHDQLVLCQGSPTSSCRCCCW